MPNRENALAAIALSVVGGILILNTPGWVAKLSGCIAGVTALSIHQRKGLHWDDYTDGFDFLANEIGDALGEMAIAPRLPAIATNLALKALPPKYKTTAETLIANYTDDGWIDQALKKGLIVCGNTGDGKTTLMNWLIAYLIEHDPETELTIIDPDYGSSHGDSEPNTWMGLPVGHVVITDEDIGVRVFLDAAKEVTRRAKQTSEAFTQGATRKPYFKPRLIVCDEALEVLQSGFCELDEDMDFDRANSRLLFRGLKQKVRAVWGVQSLLCKQLNLDETQIAQVNIILLGNAAYNRQNLSKLGLTGSKADDAIEQLKTIRQMPGCQRVCLVRINGEISIRALPDIDLKSLAIAVPEQQDPLAQWWSEVATEPRIEQAQAFITAAPGAKQTRLAVMELFGLTEAEVKKGRKDYDKYQVFKLHYEQWTKQATVAISPAPEPTPTPVTVDGLIASGFMSVPQRAS